MDRLKQKIADNDCLGAGLVLASLLYDDTQRPSIYVRMLNIWATEAKCFLPIKESTPEYFSSFVRYFYQELAFSGDKEDYFSYRHNLLDYVLEFRTGIPVSLAIVFQALAKRVGFDVYGINFPGHFLLKCQFDSAPTIYIDPLDGKYLSLPDLHILYGSILGDVEAESMPEEALIEAGCGETIVRLLHNLKASFIKEKLYAKALETVEILVNLCPDDPYERRDRGFLLHQLDCTQVAIADYRYFIRQCPEDPASQLLQAQLQQLSNQVPEIFH